MVSVMVNPPVCVKSKSGLDCKILGKYCTFSHCGKVRYIKTMPERMQTVKGQRLPYNFLFYFLQSFLFIFIYFFVIMCG